MGLVLVIIVAASFVMIAFHYWRRLWGREPGDEGRNPFVRWAITGLGVPCAAWFFFNTGILGAPIWPNVAPLSAGFGAWWSSFLDPLAAGWFFISSYWAGVTFVWLLWQIGERTEERKSFFSVCFSWSMLVVPTMALVIALGRWGALGMAMMLGAMALVHATIGSREEKPLPPSYARALAKINFGRYEEAEMEVIQELEQCEEDFDGWMMLAELYATRFDDLAAAEQSLRDLCSQPTTTPVQVSIALNRLADWQLKIAHDPVAARQALEGICARMPGTHLDRMARQRINRLPATRAELLAQEQGKPLHLPNVPDEIIKAVPVLPREQAAALANDCVLALQKNPDDVAARQKLANVLAENLGDVKGGIEQLELLLSMPGQPATRRAGWLITIASWHSRYRNDPETARLVYEEVVRDFPNTTEAFSAQRRINLINLQAQFRRRFGERMKTAV